MKTKAVAVHHPVQHNGPDLLNDDEERELIYRTRIWQSQEEYLKNRFGVKFRYAKYGWGYRNDGVYASESTMVSCDDGVYSLRSWSLCAMPETIEHDLVCVSC